MKIILFSQQLAAFRSGVGTYTTGLIHGLTNHGHEITIVVPENEAVKIPGINIITVPRSKIDFTPGGWLTLGFSFSKVLSRHSTQFDLAHFTDAREAWFVHVNSIPVTGMVNDSYALDWIESNFPRKDFADRRLRNCYYAFLRTVERLTYNRLDAVAVNGNYVGRKIINKYHLNPRKVLRIHIGLPDQPPVLPHHIPGAPSLLFVGGNFQRKGLPILLKAVARLLPKFPSIRLHVVGKDKNSNKAAIMSQIKRLGLLNKVQFHGRQPNEKVIGMMADADIFVLPSLTESFGLVYLEAMRVGTSVIATSKGEFKEIFLRNKGLLFVDPKDYEGLAIAIKKITLNPSIASSLKQVGNWASRDFNINLMTNKTENFFMKTIHSHTLTKKRHN